MNQLPRRQFLQSSLALATGFTVFPLLSRAEETPANEGLYFIGPLTGYSPQIGTLVSMLNYNRHTIIQSTKNLSKEELDFLIDDKANSIGALLMHLAAVEKYYQINSFEGRSEFNTEEARIWNDGLELGANGRKNIKGRDIRHYVELLTEVRAKTLEEFKKRDDKWLLAVDPKFSSRDKVNTYWKWFHVCEHESNHRGQISFLKSRLPGAKGSND